MSALTLTELTGDPFRSQAILTIVREAIAEGDCSLEIVSLKADRFPMFGDLGADEYLCAYQMLTGKMPEPITGTPQPINGEKAEPINGESQPIIPRDPQPGEGGYKFTRDEAQAHLKSLQDTLHLARQDRMTADEAVRHARAAMATAIAEWNGSGGGYTREMLVRDNIAASQQHKEDLAAGRVQPTQRDQRALRSVVDRQAYYSQGGTGADHVRAQFRNRGYHRGALPLSMLQGPLDINGGAMPLGPNVNPDNIK